MAFSGKSISTIGYYASKIDWKKTIYLKGCDGDTSIETVPWTQMLATMIHDVSVDLGSKPNDGCIDGCITITPENGKMYRLSFLMFMDLPYLLGLKPEDIRGKRMLVLKDITPDDIYRLEVKECFKQVRKNKFVEMTDEFKEEFNRQFTSKIDWSRFSK